MSTGSRRADIERRFAEHGLCLRPADPRFIKKRFLVTIQENGTPLRQLRDLGEAETFIAALELGRRIYQP